MTRERHLNNIIKPAAITALAFLLRLVYLLQLHTTPLWGFAAPDTLEHHSFALKILSGNLFFRESSLMNPVYPFFIAGVYLAGKQELFAVLLTQAVMDSLTCLFLYYITVRISQSGKTGLLAAGFWACYLPAIFFTGFLLDATIVVFCSLAFLLLVMRAEEHNKTSLWLFSGLALGVSLALKATLLLFVPVVLVRELRRKNHKAVLCLISGTFLILTPFSIRNYLVHNTFSPWPLNGGINFFIGNNPSANGSYLSLQNIPDAPLSQSSAALLRAEEESGREFTLASSNRYWFKQGISFIKTRPLEATALLLRKMRLFWYHREIPGNVNIYFCKPLVPLLNWPLLTFGMLAPLSILGIYTACRRHNSGIRLCLAFLLSSLVSVVVFFISSRHRLPAVPLLCSFAALAGQSLFNRANRTPPFLRSCALILTAGIILVFFPLREMDPRSVFWVSHVNIGNRLIEQGDYAQAAGHYQKAASLAPSTASVQFQLANAYFLMDRFDDAERVYQRALELDPDYAAAHFNLAVYYHFHKKDRRRALYHYLLAVSKGLPPQADLENDLFTDPPPSAAAPLAHDHKGGDHPEDDHGLSDRQ